MNISAHIIAFIPIAIWGITFISTKKLLHNGLEPADIFLYRFVLAYLCTLIFCHKRIWAQKFTDELRFILVGIFGGSLYFLTENMALMSAQASDVSIIVSSCPILTSVLMATFYKNERMTPRQYLGLIIAFIGIVFVILNGQFVLHISLHGYVLSLCAALTWALYSLFLKGFMQRYTSLFINRKVFFYGIVTIIPYYIFVKPLNTDFNILSRTEVFGNILFLGIVASMICFILWTWVMRQIGTVKATVYIYFNPLFTIIFAWLLLREHITIMALAGAAILLFGVYMAESKKIHLHRRHHKH